MCRINSEIFEKLTIRNLTQDIDSRSVIIIGGAKISSKFSVLENLLQTVDVMVLGGAMVYTLLAAQGRVVGKSLVEPDCQW